MHNFVVHSNEIGCRKSGHLGLEKFITTIFLIIKHIPRHNLLTELHHKQFKCEKTQINLEIIHLQFCGALK